MAPSVVIDTDFYPTARSSGGVYFADTPTPSPSPRGYIPRLSGYIIDGVSRSQLAEVNDDGELANEMVQIACQVVAPISPSRKASPRTIRRDTSRRTMLPEGVLCDSFLKSTRCSVAKREDVWRAWDLFEKFDCERTRQISRRQFFSGLKMCRHNEECDDVTCPFSHTDMSLDDLRMLRRSGLDSRFCTTSLPLSLHDYFKLIWPRATPDDLDIMVRWSELREARNALQATRYRVSVADIKRAFELMDIDEDGTISEDQIRDSMVFPEKNVAALLRYRTQISLEEFITICQSYTDKRRIRFMEARGVSKASMDMASAPVNNFHGRFKKVRAFVKSKSSLLKSDNR
ncbi:hypothetical protein FOL47_001646 [Perkinsus chesapeaki]|uniref:EF-hand domain-containing protein n=1 Tax=Perkinsus chesapeaki TaxID=330153 RepID=A0A7J6N1D1_PERCH|nr:hypothetical protein FOL47_001646 [Perkinsus chesapeaki]